MRVKVLEQDTASLKEFERLLERKDAELRKARSEIASLRRLNEAGDRASELAKTSLRLSALIGNLQAAVFMEDENGNIGVINQAFCDMFGIDIPPEKMIGTHYSQSSDSCKRLFKDPEGFVRRIGEVLEEKKPCLNEELEMADGRVVARDYVPILHLGQYMGHLWEYRDITYEKMRQYELSMMAKFPEENPNGVIRFLSDGTKLFNNAAGAEFSSILTGAGCRKQLDYFFRMISECLRDGERRRIEIETPTRCFEAHLAPVPKTGYINAYVVDITEIKAIQAELRESKKAAEESARAKELFLANMSHEIRTPMNAIIGMAALLKDTELTAEQADYLKAITDSGESLLVVINDILDFSKIESGRLEIEARTFNVEELLDNLVRSMQPKFRQKNLKLYSHSDKNIPPYLLSDPTRLNQILTNLVGNALKFTHRGMVELTAYCLREKEGASLIRFSVKDTGIGIHPEKHEMIFESFRQEEAGITRKYGGTGLGLAISRQLVHLLGGEIRVRSELGNGAEFWFDLWLKHGTEMPATNERKPVMQNDLLRGKKVLLVDDNHYNRKLAQIILERWGIGFDTAENGVEAVALARKNTYDLILMDIQMPQMGGTEATGIIRKDLGSDVPIIALTANAIQGDMQKYIAAGMNDYLSKPFVPADLWEKLCRLLCADRDRNVGPAATPAANLYSTRELDELGEGSPDFTDRMLRIFVSEISSRLQQLRQATGTGDLARIKAIAHEIFPMVCSMDIGVIVGDLTTLKDGNPAGADARQWNSMTERIVKILESVTEDLKVKGY